MARPIITPPKPAFIEPLYKAGVKGGCLVSGSLKDASGQGVGEIVFTPENSGEWRGTYYAVDRIRVTTANDGSFSVQLVPSSILGRYRVRAKDKGIKLMIEVPETDRAKFHDLIVEG